MTKYQLAKEITETAIKQNRTDLRYMQIYYVYYTKEELWEIYEKLKLQTT